MASIRPAIDILRKRIHVGCGPKALKSDWLNVDIRKFPGVDFVSDITKPWVDLFEVQYVYGEHFIEHLTLQQAMDFLSHSLTAMATNGRLRLSTPSLEWVMATHFDVNQTEPDTIINQTMAINRAFHGWGHQFLWSKPMLKSALLASGYKDVKFYGYGESDDEFLVGIEEHGGYKVQNGFPSTWIVEAVKGPGDPRDNLFQERIEKDFLRYVRSGH